MGGRVCGWVGEWGAVSDCCYHHNFRHLHPTYPFNFLPRGSPAFHVVVYAHGIGGGIDGCDSWLTTVASRGLIVIAPFTSGGACETEYQDILLALSAARKGGAALHPALQRAFHNESYVDAVTSIPSHTHFGCPPKHVF